MSMLPSFDKQGRLKPTAQVPLLNPEQIKMLDILERETLFDLACYLRAYAKDLLQKCNERQDVSTLHRSLSKVVDDPPEGTLMHLLHSVSKTTLRSVILGTVAYQKPQPLVDGDSGEVEEPIELYGTDGSGAYLSQIHVKDRRGWCTAPELKELVGILQSYRDTYRDYPKWPQNDKKRTAAQRKDIERVRQIDGVYASKGQGHKPLPLFNYLKGQADQRAESLDKFLSALGAVLRQMDEADKTTHLLWSPSYVGASNYFMGDRSLAHSAIAGQAYGSSNFLMWLVQSCMYVMKLRPEVVSTPIIRMWEDGQVPMAEILLTMLASSVVERAGFNSHPPGTIAAQGKTDRSWDPHKEAVFAKHPWYGENMAESMAAVQKRSSLLDFLQDDPVSQMRRQTLEYQEGLRDVKKCIEDGEASSRKTTADIRDNLLPQLTVEQMRGQGTVSAVRELAAWQEAVGKHIRGPRPENEVISNTDDEL